jgi:hypothetical protein
MRRKGQIICVFGQKHKKHALDMARTLASIQCWKIDKPTIITGKNTIKAMAKTRGLQCHG